MINKHFNTIVFIKLLLVHQYLFTCLIGTGTGAGISSGFAVIGLGIDWYELINFLN